MKHLHLCRIGLKKLRNYKPKQRRQKLYIWRTVNKSNVAEEYDSDYVYSTDTENSTNSDNEEVIRLNRDEEDRLKPLLIDQLKTEWNLEGHFMQHIGGDLNEAAVHSLCLYTVRALQWIHYYKHNEQLTCNTLFDSFVNTIKHDYPLIAKYTAFLEKELKFKPSTICNIMSSLLTTLKWFALFYYNGDYDFLNVHHLVGITSVVSPLQKCCRKSIKRIKI